MARDISSEETTVVAIYTARHDAEVAKSFLEDQGITSFVVADDVHPPIQLTGGVRLFVMSREAQNARTALEDARMIGEQPPAEELYSGDGADTRSAKPARMAPWVYVVGFVLLILAVVAGLLIST